MASDEETKKLRLKFWRLVRKVSEEETGEKLTKPKVKRTILTCLIYLIGYVLLIVLITFLFVTFVLPIVTPYL